MPNARELDQYLNQGISSMHEENPDRILFEGFLEDVRKHERLMDVVKNINKHLGQFSDETLISDVIPPYISTVSNTGAEAAKEARANYPAFSTMHENADPAEKGHLARFVRTLRDPFVELEGITTLGDLRSTSIDNLIKFKSGKSPFPSRIWAAVVKQAVKESNSEVS